MTRWVAVFFGLAAFSAALTQIVLHLELRGDKGPAFERVSVAEAPAPVPDPVPVPVVVPFPVAAAEPKGPPPLPEGVLPFPSDIGGAYALTDHFGRVRTERDPDGRPQLVFFGYANCDAICSVALPRMGETVDLLAAKDLAVTPLLITVDPARDTPETMRPILEAIHPEIIGLTGDEAALAVARDAFQVERSLIGEAPDVGAIYAHGSFVYLMDAEGRFLTLMPPILGPERMAEIAEGYLTANSDG